MLKKPLNIVTLCLLFLNAIQPGYGTSLAFKHLQKAYPSTIQSVSSHKILWKDGTFLTIEDDKHPKTEQEKLDTLTLYDQLTQPRYTRGIPKSIEYFTPENDPGRIRYEPFFRKMYGNSKKEVESHLVTIYWMPKVFGLAFPLKVTTVNHIDRRFISISNELEHLVEKHPEYLPYLDNPGGTFQWRLIANTKRLSLHSFGMTIDINSNRSDYWQWTLLKNKQLISESAQLQYQNHIPWDVVTIFEKYGFIWGGKWRHYDTMHFEYRPELF